MRAWRSLAAPIDIPFAGGVGPILLDIGSLLPMAGELRPSGRAFFGVTGRGLPAACLRAHELCHPRCVCSPLRRSPAHDACQPTTRGGFSTIVSHKMRANVKLELSNLGQLMPRPTVCHTVQAAARERRLADCPTCNGRSPSFGAPSAGRSMGTNELAAGTAPAMSGLHSSTEQKAHRARMARKASWDGSSERLARHRSQRSA